MLTSSSSPSIIDAFQVFKCVFARCDFTLLIIVGNRHSAVQGSPVKAADEPGTHGELYVSGTKQGLRVLKREFHFTRTVQCWTLG